MKTLAYLAILVLAIAGCVQTPPPASNNTTNITPPANNTTAVPPGYEVKDYCQKDGDCVRLNSCCDCGLGVYVNTYNQKPECPPGEPVCKCAIAPSKGVCESARCVAVADNPSVTPPEVAMSFHYGQGECGPEVAPVRVETEDGIMLSGAVGEGSVCRTAIAEFTRVDDYYVLNISTRAIPGVAACIMCIGAIPWEANITGYDGLVEVYYNGRKVLPASAAGFCGTSTNYACSNDSDCITGGCSGQVCQAAAEPPVITTCEYRECYSAQAYGVGCGCHSGKCRWQ